MNLDTTNKETLCDSLKKLVGKKCNDIKEEEWSVFMEKEHYINTPNELKLNNCLKIIELIDRFDCAKNIPDTRNWSLD